MTAPTSPTAAVPPGFDFASPDLLAERIPLAEFALLRRTGAPWWNGQPRGRTGFDDDGFWVISRHAHIKDISRDHEQWSSNANGSVIRFNERFGPEELGVQRENLLLHMDPPPRSSAIHGPGPSSAATAPPTTSSPGSSMPTWTGAA